jgi:ribulose-5-phosphate 4-epimerase/fuculose-1-phosphate aldolase
VSDNTLCNYCRYMQSVRMASRNGMAVTIRQNDDNSTDLYVHPKGVMFAELSEDEKKQYHRVWYMHLPNHCCC